MSQPSTPRDPQGLPEGGFAAVPNALLADPDVTINAVMTYLSLATWTGCKKIVPSIPAIAERAKISPRSVTTATTLLVEKGWVEVEKQRQGNRNAVNRYRLVTPWIAVSDSAGRAVSTNGSDCKISIFDTAPGAVEEDKEQEDKEQHRRTRPRTTSSFPASFAPSLANKAYADENSLDLDHELAQFENHAKAKGLTYLDWQAALRTWLGNSAKWNQQRRSTRTNGRETQADRAVRLGIPEAWA